MKGMLGFAAMNLSTANVIESITYVSVDNNFNRVQSGYSRRTVSGNFPDVLSWLLKQNWYLYNVFKVTHMDGTSTISIHHSSKQYSMTPDEIFNFLYASDNNLPIGEAK